MKRPYDSSKLVRYPVRQNSKPDRNKDIVTRRGEGFTLASIAKEFGITRERVSQILAKYGHGSAAERLTSRKVLVMKYKVPKSWIIKAENITQVKKGSGKFYSDEDVRKIQVALTGITDLRKCKICGTPLQSTRRLILCDSPDCTRKNNATRRKYPVRTRRASGIIRAAAEATEGLPPGDEWIYHKEAHTIVGTVTEYISYMRYNGVIAAKENPSRLHRATGKPTYLYSKIHAEAAGRAIRSHKEKEANGQVQDKAPEGGVRQGPPQGD